MVQEVGFGTRLHDACKQKDSAVCVGLDPRWGSLPESLRDGVTDGDLESMASATTRFCCDVVDAVADYTAVLKPQAAFFECLGPHGMLALGEVVSHARKVGLLVLLDGKRGDIGSTAQGYASAYLGEQAPWQCDALTVNPYLGSDTLLPFIEASRTHSAGIFVLVKTSNPGSGFIQDVQDGERAVFEKVAAFIQQQNVATCDAAGFGCVGAVVGATYPEQLAHMRAAMPNAWILIPGFGAQGGTAEDVRHGFRNMNDGRKSGAVVNSSRGIIFAYQQSQYAHLDWQQAVAGAARDMRDQLQAVS